MKRFGFQAVIAAALAASLTLALPAVAKDEGSEGGSQKVIAVGNVNTSNIGFSSMSPEQLSELFRVRAKKRLEKKGDYKVILPEAKQSSSQTASDQPQKMPTTAADAMKYAAEMQRQFQQAAAESRGQRTYYPVQADALVDFNVQTGTKEISTGGVMADIGHLTGTPSLGDTDFSSSSLNMTVSCLLRNPQTGSLQDEYTAKASSTKVARVGGVSYYTMEDTSDPDRAFDRMFKRALDKCAKWIEKQVK